MSPLHACVLAIRSSVADALALCGGWETRRVWAPSRPAGARASPAASATRSSVSPVQGMTAVPVLMACVKSRAGPACRRGTGQGGVLYRPGSWLRSSKLEQLVLWQLQITSTVCQRACWGPACAAAPTEQLTRASWSGLLRHLHSEPWSLLGRSSN